MDNIFSIYDFFAEGKKSKYRWFKVVGFGGGGLVGSKKSVTCPVSQRVSCVNDSSLNDANWHHFSEMIPNGIIYFSDLYLVFLTNLKVWKVHKHDGPTFFFG